MKKVDFKSIVAETLLIPLYMRAKESRRKDAILRDEMAEYLVENIEYDYTRFDGAKMSEIGCVVRGRYFDDAVRRFIVSHKNPIVVNVGWTRATNVSVNKNRLFFMKWIYPKS